MRLVNVYWKDIYGQASTTSHPVAVNTKEDIKAGIPDGAVILGVSDVTNKYFNEGSPRELWKDLTRLGMSYEQKYLICALLRDAIASPSMTVQAKQPATKKRKGRAKATATA